MESFSDCKKRTWHWQRAARQIWVTETRPLLPREIKNLYADSIGELTDDEKLIDCLAPEYDSFGGLQLIVPEVYYPDGVETGPGNWNAEMWDIPLAEATRDNAIDTIENCVNQEVPEGITPRLVDAWKTEKVSREYLNDEMDKFDLDKIYYSAAYKDREATNN
jgi:hypothetical protein